jgi:hypothetical protein
MLINAKNSLKVTFKSEKYKVRSRERSEKQISDFKNSTKEQIDQAIMDKYGMDKENLMNASIFDLEEQDKSTFKGTFNSYAKPVDVIMDHPLNTCLIAAISRAINAVNPPIKRPKDLARINRHVQKTNLENEEYEIIVNG